MRRGVEGKLCLSLETDADADAEEAAVLIHTLGPQGRWLLQGYSNISENTTMSDWTVYSNAVLAQWSRCIDPCWPTLIVYVHWIYFVLDVNLDERLHEHKPKPPLLTELVLYFSKQIH